MNSMMGGYTWEGDRGVIIFFTPKGNLPASAPWSEWEKFERRVQEEPLAILMPDKTIQVPGKVFVPIHLADFGEFLRVIPEVLEEIRQERARGPASYFELMVDVAEHEYGINIQGVTAMESGPSLPLIWPSQKGQSSGFLF